MSRLGSQIDRLRTAAQTERTLGNYELEQMLLDAADTITELRDESDCVGMAAYELGRKSMADENAKLRTFLGGNSIVTDYWKDEDGTMHVLTTDGEHTYEYMRGGLAEENTKLRELADELYPLADYGAMDASELDRAHDLMRKLGIGVG